MVATDEDALVCDMMETYGVTNWRVLPLRFAATLAFGLRDDSRIKSAMSGAKYSLNTMLLASIADGLNALVWMQTEDARKGRNRPKRISDAIIGNQNTENGFDSVAEFEAARARILEG